MEIQAYFVGFQNFVSKAGKECFILSFLPIPQANDDGSACYSEITKIFTDSTTYDTIVNSKKLMELVPLKVTVNGSRVYYNL